MEPDDRTALATRLAHEIMSSADDFADRYIVLQMTMQAYMSLEAERTRTLSSEAEPPPPT